jgi:parallel beta-helix repeat protein
MSFLHLLLAARKKQPTVVKHSYFHLKLNSMLLLALLSSSLGWLVLPSLATPLAGTAVENQATGTYVDTLNSESVSTESNIVKIVVGEVAGISIISNSFSGTVSAGNTVYFSYVITNIGNDATQFYIPENAKVTGSGAQNGNIQITGYNLTGTTPVSLAASAYVDVATGIATGDAAALAANGIIQPGGSVTVRVPVKVNTTSVVNDSITVLLGDTPEIATSTTTPKEHLQNQAYIDENVDQKYDVYTVDNPGGTTGEFNNVPPLNGDAVNHRQEASAAQKVTVIGVDYGDAPDTGAGTGPGNYKTTLSDGGPSHVIVTGLSIGTKVDSDSSILQNVTADADNTNGTPNDEDGVVGLPVLKTIPGQTYTVQVKVTNTTGQPAYLVGYIDFNQNGDFGDVEDKSVTITVPSGATVGTYNVTFTTPADMTPGTTYLRLRLGSVQSEAESSVGAASSGEVEDYALPIISPATITGTVFEDPNYGGGLGRPLSTIGISSRANARVELYDSTGIYKGFALTDSNGLYTFDTSNVTGGVIAGDYKIRVVNDTVTSSRGTGSLYPVQTFRTNAGVTAGTVSSVTDHVGGEKPAETDAPARTGTQTLTDLNNLTGNEVQSITAVKVGTDNIAGIDFGFNFDTIVNTNDAGQGSLRQFIINSNALGGETSLAQAGKRKDKFNVDQSLPVGVETSIFMIPSNVDPLGRPKDPGFNTTRGVAQIIPLTVLPTITGVNANATSIDGTTQTVNIGDKNVGVLGRGGKVGVDQLTLNQVQRPEIEIFGNNQFNGATNRGINASGVADFTVRGLAAYNFYISIEASNVTRPTIEQNIIGSKADSWADPGSNKDIHKNLLFNTGTTNGLVQNNLLGFTTNNDSLTFVGTTNSTITNNDCQAGAVGSGSVGDCYTLYDSNTNNTIRGNLATDISANGIDVLRGSNSNLIENNTIRNAGMGGVETAGIRITDYYPAPLLPSSNNIVRRNIVSGSTGSGILVTSGLGNTISENSLYANGTLGIDLLKSAELDSRNTGLVPYVTANDGLIDNTASNNGIDYPVITYTKLDSATGSLRVGGFVGKPTNVANFGGVKLEFFIADNSPNNQNGEVILGDGKSKSHGEGRTYLGSCIALGTSKFDCSFVNAGALGLTDATNITATATDGNGNTSEFSAVPNNPAKLVLVKRITAITDVTTNITTTFGNFVDDGTANNTLDGWNVGSGSYLLGALNNGVTRVKPGDEVEYTIYYLNSGENPVSQARVCDRLNADLIMQPQFDTLATSDQGILLVRGTSSQYLTNTSGDDSGFVSTSSTMPVNCNITGNGTSNLSSNVVVVDAATNSNPLLTGERGYIKFKVKVRK